MGKGDLHKSRFSDYWGRAIYHSVLVVIYQSAVSYRHECLLSVVTFNSLRLVLQAEQLYFPIVNEQKKKEKRKKEQGTLSEADAIWKILYVVLGEENIIQLACNIISINNVLCFMLCLIL